MQKTCPWCIAISAASFAVIYSYYQVAFSPDTLATMSTPLWYFAAQRGFFTHDDDPASWEFRAKTQPSLGLRERSYPTDDDFWAAKGTAPAELGATKWPRFQYYIKQLNSHNPENEQYKILFVVRHGQGLHNVKETEVGRDEWNVGTPRLMTTCSVRSNGSSDIGQSSLVMRKQPGSMRLSRPLVNSRPRRYRQFGLATTYLLHSQYTPVHCVDVCRQLNSRLRHSSAKPCQ
jgi:hypothetical protein